MKAIWKVTIKTLDGQKVVVNNVGPYEDDDEGILYTALEQYGLDLADLYSYSCEEQKGGEG